MFAQIILALLTFCSLTSASDPGCDELIKPLKDRNKVYGKWIFNMMTSDSEEYLKAMKVVNSSRSEISPIPGSDEFDMRYVDKIDGKCIPGTVNSSTSGDAIKVVFHFNNTSYEHVGRYLETCSDCVLWTDETVVEVDGVARKSKNLFLLTKTGKLDASDLEVFKKQAKCLNFLPDFYFPDTTDLCPDEKEPATDGTTEEQ
ncbi:uncharacterized protein LOC108234508 [Kryptolebias marmoratus]|uniref:Uncharacterized LOC108234508 n=1 Tax=Kryptolebias marmoratus TaxID=37003 RepID=A0A3Q3AHI0_KRYMA|nr:uncharacterized protein LOC108234508 [Kryptolebias marmoratus]